MATSWACTAAHSWRPSGSSGVPSGARNSSCSYLARIHDSRSSLKDQGSMGRDLRDRLRTSAVYPGDPLGSPPPHQSVPSHIPRGVPRGFGSAPCVALPHAVGHIVANGRQHQGQLPRPVVQVQRANAGQVCAQVPVNARALDAYKCAQVQAGPRGVWGRSETLTLDRANMGTPKICQLKRTTPPPRPLHCPLALTGSPAVHADRVPLGIPDRLDSHGFALAVCAQLQKGLGLLMTLSRSPSPDSKDTHLCFLPKPSHPRYYLDFTALTALQTG